LTDKLTDILISALVNDFAAKFEIFVLSTLKKYQQFSHVGPWSATYDPTKIFGFSTFFTPKREKF